MNATETLRDLLDALDELHRAELAAALEGFRTAGDGLPPGIDKLERSATAHLDALADWLDRGGTGPMIARLTGARRTRYGPAEPATVYALAGDGARPRETIGPLAARQLEARS